MNNSKYYDILHHDNQGKPLEQFQITKACSMSIGSDGSKQSTDDSLPNDPSDITSNFRNNIDLKSYVCNSFLKAALYEMLQKDLNTMYKDVMDGGKYLTEANHNNSKNKNCGHFHKPHYAKVRICITP